MMEQITSFFIFFIFYFKDAILLLHERVKLQNTNITKQERPK